MGLNHKPTVCKTVALPIELIFSRSWVSDSNDKNIIYPLIPLDYSENWTQPE